MGIYMESKIANKFTIVIGILCAYFVLKYMFSSKSDEPIEKYSNISSVENMSHEEILTDNDEKLQENPTEIYETASQDMSQMQDINEMQDMSQMQDMNKMQDMNEMQDMPD